MMRVDALGCTDNQDIRLADKEAGLDDPWNLVQGDFQVSRLVDPREVHI
jgi:hypothetical protein